MRQSNRSDGQSLKAKGSTPFSRRKRPGGCPSAAEAELIADHILEAGWQLLLEEGFERFSFDRLARAASVGKPTIYSRFANKHEYSRVLLEHRLTKRKNEVALASLRCAVGLRAMASIMPNGSCARRRIVEK